MGTDLEKHSGKQLRGNPKWKKGQSGNPAGRPRKEICLTSILKEHLERPVPAEILNKLPVGVKNKITTWGDALMAMAAFHALKGNPSFLKEILERVEGKVKEQVEVSGGVRVLKIPEKASSREAWAAQHQLQK